MNLLNLPGHYHNGGIGPHIGGMWIRFNHGWACASWPVGNWSSWRSSNRQGIRSEWEFNEWAHAETGRPMGKRLRPGLRPRNPRAYLELVVDDSDQD